MSLFRTSQWYTPELLRSNPDFTFVFGDNFLRRGKGGQALIRDEDNALGLATKLAPDNNDQSFLDDYYNAGALSHEIRRVLLTSVHRNVIIPFSDRVELGTGLSQLPERAPKLYLLLSQIFTSNLPEAPLK